MVARTALAAVLVAAAAGLLGACDGGESAAASGGARYLVLPGDAPGLAVVDEQQPGSGYATGIVRPDATATVARVRPGVRPGSWEELSAGAARATLANGLEVAYVCGGRAVSPAPQDDPTGATVTRIAGPLMVMAQVEGGYLTVEDTPTDTGACTPPTAVSGPLVDVAASLVWVDQAGFDRLLADHPAPAREAPPTTG